MNRRSVTAALFTVLVTVLLIALCGCAQPDAEDTKNLSGEDTSVKSDTANKPDSYGNDGSSGNTSGENNPEENASVKNTEENTSVNENMSGSAATTEQDSMEQTSTEQGSTEETSKDETSKDETSTEGSSGEKADASEDGEKVTYTDEDAFMTYYGYVTAVEDDTCTIAVSCSYSVTSSLARPVSESLFTLTDSSPQKTFHLSEDSYVRLFSADSYIVNTQKPDNEADTGKAAGTAGFTGAYTDGTAADIVKGARISVFFGTKGKVYGVCVYNFPEKKTLPGKELPTE